MFKNFFKTTFRTLAKNKTYSFLNIFGLAIGVACAALIFLWVEDELNYNNFQLKKDNICAIGNNQSYDGKMFTFSGVYTFATPGPLAEALKTDIPGVVNSCRIAGNNNVLFGMGDKSVFENGMYASPSVFNMFTFQFLQGNTSDVFKQPNSIVITEKMAKHFFGDDKNVIGKTLKADNMANYAVTGVVKSFPENSSITFEWVCPFEVYLQQRDYLKTWGANSIDTYVELAPNANVAAINKKIYGYIQTKNTQSNAHLFLFSMNDWRLRNEFVNGNQAGGRIVYVRLFSVIAWIILFIACINFMNLATARSEKRAREVGVRKVLGAGKAVLIFQFIGEAVCMAAIAVFAGVILISFVLPLFNTLVEKHLTLGLNNPLHITALISIALLCGLVAGSYPALYLSAFNPVYVFKGIKLKGGSASFIRRALVVLQFTVSIVLIISTVIIYQQIQHIKNRDLGYNRNNLVTMNIHGDMVKNYDAIKQELISTGVIDNVGLNSMSTLYTGDNGPVTYFDWPGKNPNLNVLVSFRSISPGFINTAGMQMVEGHEFTSEKTDTTNILCTQAFEKIIGNGSAVGHTLTHTNNDGTKNVFHIIGVVKDYVYGDMYGSPDPVLFACNPQGAALMFVRIKAGAGTEQALAKMETVMKKYNPAYPFDYNFVDDQFNSLFSDVTLVSKLSRLFAGLAILISCLGLFGLSAFTAERRTKEIGIRKVLGASAGNVTGLLSKEFMQLVLLSSLIAFPVAWWFMHSWLQNYAYRVTIGWWVFLIAAAAAMFIALATISFQAVKAALANPVKSLRTE